MAGDDGFLIGVQHLHRNQAVGAADEAAAAAVRWRVELHAQPACAFDDACAQHRGVLADATGEHQPVDAAQRRSHAGEFAQHLLNEIIDRQASALRTRGQQLAHVARHAGQAEQPGFAVQQPADVVSAAPVVLQQVQHDGGIEPAATRPHGQAVEG